MTTDARSLRFESMDEAQRWRVFLAVENTARHAAAQQGVEIAATMSLKHADGEFHRDSVADAKDAVDRNGFRPWEMWLYIKRVTADEDRPAQVLDPWVSANLLSGTNRVISVAVRGDSEVEVDGVFASLERAVNQARHDPQPLGASDAVGASAGWRIHSVPLPRNWISDVSAQVVAGIVVVVVVAIAGVLWAFLR